MEKRPIPYLHLALLTIAFLLAPGVKAQIRTPNGDTLELKTGMEYLYLETQFFFNTGMYKASHYKWKKIYDSIYSQWFVTACFNGQCRNLLEDTGTFSTDLGVNDTTGFIAFHVETYKHSGTTKIRYLVYNKHDSTDKAELMFIISYKNATGMGDLNTMPSDRLTIVNPAHGKIVIFNHGASITGDISLFDLQGRNVFNWVPEQGVNDRIALELPAEFALNGLFILKMNLDSRTIQARVLID